jgi:phosphate transport system permease protein
VNATPRAAPFVIRRRIGDRLGDGALYVLSVLASLAAAAAIFAIAYKVLNGASGSFSRFGLGFVGHATWNPVTDVYGAGTLLFGTAVSSLMALLLAAPIGIAIGLYLSLLAPRRVRGVIGPLVEMLAAIPSVVLGLWGILVLGPFLSAHLEPWLHSALGFIPLFGDPSPSGSGLFNAGLILTIMVVPIIASISRDLFLAVPHELREGAVALGATRWEMIRGVALSSTAPGLAAASILGMGRALGEAIAVSQVIGSATAIHASLFGPADTLAARVATQFQGATTKLQTESLFYLAAILLVIGLLANLTAQGIIRRFGYRHVSAA